MPEGHTIHRCARLHARALRGHAVEADSPQGRFADGAATVSGRALEAVDAHGKHLLYRFAPDLTLHVHLGLFGRFRRFRAASEPEPSPATRLRLRGDGVVLHLSGPSACELLDAEAEAALRARLGPDPLRGDADPERFVAALARRRAPIGQVLLDQAVVAGVGNVYRAEVLHRAGIDPFRPARALTPEEAQALWDDLVVLLRAGERSGRIVTVDGASRDGGERVHAYRRAGEPCTRCGQAITSARLAGRTIFSCPSCQR